VATPLNFSKAYFINYNILVELCCIHVSQYSIITIGVVKSQCQNHPKANYLFQGYRRLLLGSM
jgi:hypothetical protein